MNATFDKLMRLLGFRRTPNPQEVPAKPRRQKTVCPFCVKFVTAKTDGNPVKHNCTVPQFTINRKASALPMSPAELEEFDVRR